MSKPLRIVVIGKMAGVSVLKRLLTAIYVGMTMLIASTPVSWVSAEVATPESDQPPNRAIAFYPEDTGPGSFISVEIDSGEQQTVNVVLGNAGEIDQVLRAYAVPALSGVGGGFVLAEHGTEPDEATSWVDFPESEYSFAPTEGLSLPVEIAVPEGTTPGEYVTALAVEQRDAFDVPGTDMFLQRVRWSLPILITVPGERQPAFELGDITLTSRDDVLIAEINIANTGNVIVRPEGEIQLINDDGVVIGIASVSLDSVYVGTETTFTAAWPSVLASTSYSVEGQLSAEEGSVSQNVTASDLAVTVADSDGEFSAVEPLTLNAELVPLSNENPPSMLQLTSVILNSEESIDDARVSIVTYQDGVEVDRYPIMQAVTIDTGSTPIEARYSLPGGFTDGTYTFEVTIEIGTGGTQTVLATQAIDFTVTVDD